MVPSSMDCSGSWVAPGKCACRAGVEGPPLVLPESLKPPSLPKGLSWRTSGGTSKGWSNI